MRTITLLLGLLITAAVTAATALGWLEPWERETIDARFAASPGRRRPMTGQIVHVDIDDGALDSVGRWPWDRSTLADAIDELARADAATVALDIVLSDPQSPEHVPGSTEPVDHDRRLAEAMGRVPCIVAVELRRPRLDPMWSSAVGRRELERLLDRLAHGIADRAPTIAAQVGLTGPRRERFLARPLALKELAAWEALRELDAHHADALTYEQFLETVAPGVVPHTGRFAEQRLLARLWRQRTSWRELHSTLIAPGSGSADDVAPLPALARAAAGAGFVNVERQIDPDGEVRSMPVTLPASGGAALQLGIAAAAHHLGIPAAALTPDAPTLVVGDRTIPLRKGRAWIDWPTSSTDPAWEGVFRRREADPPRLGHLSIAALVSLAEQRRRLAVLQRRHDLLGGQLAAFVLQDATLADTVLSGELLTAMRDEVEFRIEDHETLLRETGADEKVDLLPEEIELVYQCREWRALDRAVAAGRVAIDNAEQSLRRRIEGRLVFVGWTAGGAVADFVATPLGPLTPGVVVHAALADMVLTGRAVRFPPPWLGVLLTTLAGLLGTLIAARISTLGSIATIGLVLGGFAAAVVIVFVKASVVLPLLAPIISGSGAWMTCTVLLASVSQRERRRIARQFRARVSTQLVEYLRANPDSVSMGGEQREITVLFADLAGFTAMSERLGGPATVGTLNRYLGELTRTLIADGAYVNKFLGDGLMAFWSAFTPDPEQAPRACLAAMDCLHAVACLNRSGRWPGAPPVHVRMGLATGQAIVGDCGAPPLLNDYTAIGDVVNLAARLESANKQFGTRVLIDRRTRELLGGTEVATRPLGRIVVVGQSLPVDIFEVLPADSDNDLAELSGRVVQAFRARQFGAAVSALDEMERRSGPSRFCSVYRRAMLDAGEDFDGVLRLSVK